MNDNILKQVLIFMVSTGVWKGKLGDAGEAWIAMLFTIPFILFSGYGGQFADRNSKQWVTVLLKILEIPIVAIAMYGLWTHNLGITIGSLALLGVHSTFFGPAKYGMIPEVVSDDDLSRANGTINMLTNIAVIVGTLLAGPISDLYYPTAPDASGSVPRGVYWLPGAALLCVAFLGLGASLVIPRLPPRDPTLKYNLNPVATYVDSIREMARSPLLMVAIAWSYFYMLASTALLVLTHYKDLLGISYKQNSYLLGAMGVAIGLGCFLAGLISGRRIELRLIPAGAVGMSVLFAVLGLVPPIAHSRASYFMVMGFLATAGIFAGFYIVPLQALLQHLSPADERGRFLGTANAMSFMAFMFGAVVDWLATSVGRLPHNRVFLVVAALSLVGTSFMLWRMKGMLRQKHA